jgi:nucleoside-diphosphate-sugar epimerase
MAHVFLTGGTGYLGRALISELLARGHTVRALARPGSEDRLPQGVTVVSGNPLEAGAWMEFVRPSDTFVHLVGTPRPNPSKAREFREIDLASARVAAEAAVRGGVRHFVYVSVAHPAPVMHAYIEARVAAESIIRGTGLDATILRPWYVLGPGHWWPAVLIPIYAVLRRVPCTAASARRLGLVTRQQMVNALARAVEDPPTGTRIVEVPAIEEGV